MPDTWSHADSIASFSSAVSGIGFRLWNSLMKKEPNNPIQVHILGSVLLFAVCGNFAFAANIPIRVLGTTQTQVQIQYTAPSASACTVTAVDQNGGPSVYDLDASLFTGADQDLSRTTANSFRWPTLVNGFQRTVFIGGHSEVKKALNLKWYVTALQSASSELITVTCGGDSGSVTATTANIELGSHYPELPIPIGSPVGNAGYPQPTLDWTPNGRKTPIIDPSTGILMMRVSGPSDNYNDSQPGGPFAFVTPAIDSSSAWTNPNNAVNSYLSSTATASTSTTNAPLFIPFSPGFSSTGSEPVNDLQVLLWGYSTSGTEVAEVCLSLDGGPTCHSGTQDVTFTHTSGASCIGTPASCLYSGIPSTFATFSAAGMFSDWGMNDRELGYDFNNVQYTGANASGSTITISTPPSPCNGTECGFYLDTPPGSKFTMTSCASGSAPDPLTVATVNDYGTITTVETGLSLTNCTFTDLHSGLRIILKTAGTINLSATFKSTVTRSDNHGSNGARYQCAKSPVTNIAKDCDGATQSPAQSGFLCPTGVGIYLYQPWNGRFCLQGNYYGGATVHMQYAVPASNNTFVGPDFSGNLYSAAFTGTDYTEFQAPVNHGASPHDNFTYTNLGAVSAVTAKVKAQMPTSITAINLNTGLWPDLALETGGVLEQGYQFISCAGGSGDRASCIYAWLDPTLTTVLNAQPWGFNGYYPNRWGNTHAGPTSIGNYSLKGSGGSLVTALYTPGALFSGPWWTGINTITQNGTPSTHSLSISAATAGTPITLTSANNNLDAPNHFENANAVGGPITCSGGTGSWTVINGTWDYKWIDNSNFTLYSDPLTALGGGSGSLTGTVTCTVSPALYNLPFSLANNSGTARGTVNVSDGGFLQYFPSGISPMQDGDSVQFNNEQTTPYYAKVSGLSNGVFDVYTDLGLTTKANYTDINALLNYTGNKTVMNAEACPDPATVTLPGPLYYDDGWGPVGGPTKIRCKTLTYKNIPTSSYVGTGEHAAYPCSYSPADTTISCIGDFQVGDGLFDQSHVGGKHESFLVLSKTATTITVLRYYGDVNGWGNPRNVDNYAGQHAYGWSLIGYPLAWSGWIDYTINTTLWAGAQPVFSHSDYSQCGASGLNGCFAYAWPPGSFDNITNQALPGAFSSTLTNTKNTMAVWDNLQTSSMTNVGNCAEAYPSWRQIWAYTPVSERNWTTDWPTCNLDSGNSNNNIDGNPAFNINLTLVAGQTHTWKVNNPAPSVTLNTKVIPYFAHSSPHGYYNDESSASTGDIISDSTPGFCIALNAGECRSASSANDIYMSGQLPRPNYNGPSGTYKHAVTNAGTFSTLTFVPMGPEVGEARQYLSTPIDYTGTAQRLLTRGFALPTTQYSYNNVTVTPDGKYGFFGPNPLNGTPRYQQTEGNYLFAMKFPTWPNVDTANRTGYINYPIGLSGTTGDTLRIKFGYAENGAASSYFCTTRLEACYTSSTATPTAPFQYAGETQHLTTWTAGLSIKIPAIAGRVLYYSICRTPSGGSETCGGMNAVAVP
jgi:hypothetical protein